MNTQLLFRWIIILPLLLGACRLQAQTTVAENAAAPVGKSAIPLAPPAARPKVALVLSGGGARGFAHIGVLRALKKMHIPVDMVVGTSMGAVIGGAYAAGRSAGDLEQTVKQTDWEQVLADRPERNDLDFRRKEEDNLIPTRLEFAVTKNGASLPAAAAGNVALENALTRLLPEGMRDHPVDQLALPFRSVASDLLTGDKVELDDTPLLPTMRASLAVPGVFSPVRIKDRLVVDGGLVSNLPVETARAMGADIIIAVNVGTPLAKERELRSAIDVAVQMLQILTEQNVQRSIRQLHSQDILIAPELDGMSFLDFSQYQRAIEAGEKATMKLAERLGAVRLTEQQYQQFDEQRIASTRAVLQPILAMPIRKIEVSGTQYINPEALIAQTGLSAGQIRTQEQIRSATTRLYGRGDIDQLETVINDTEDGREVLIKPKESIASRNRVRLGLELASDFSDDNRFSLSMMHIASSLNNYGAELRTMVRLGSRRMLATEFWQPLAPASPWYIQPGFEYNADSADIFSNQRPIARLGTASTDISFRLGRQLSNWGSLEAGISRGFQHVTSVLPDLPLDPNNRFYDTTQFAQFKLDTLDSVAFPSKGSMLSMLVQRAPGKDSGTPSRATSEIDALQAFQFGQWDGHLYGEWGHSHNTTIASPLGGFLRLSGTPRNSLSGDSSLFGRIVIGRKIGSLPTTFGSAVRLAMSAELGGTYGASNPYSFGNLKQAGSISLSVDTRFGPLYFGVGATRGMGTSTYLFLGPIW